MENLIKKNSFLKDVSLVGFSKFFIILFGLGTSIIIARILGPEKNGLIASLYVYPAIFISIGSLGIRQSATYFLGKDIYSEFDSLGLRKKSVYILSRNSEKM
jgi:O-antigen/teichoic acid export membrane protein